MTPDGRLGMGENPTGEEKPLVAEDVIATYAADAARSVPGIVDLHGSAWQEFSERMRDVPAKGVLARFLSAHAVEIDVHVKVAWGCVIPDLARRVQEAVTKKVETLLDLEVQSVTLFVDEVEAPPELSQA